MLVFPLRFRSPAALSSMPEAEDAREAPVRRLLSELDPGCRAASNGDRDRTPFTPGRIEAGEAGAAAAGEATPLRSPSRLHGEAGGGFDGTGSLSTAGTAAGTNIVRALLEMAVRDAPMQATSSPDVVLLIGILNRSNVDAARWLLNEVYSLEPERAKVQGSALLRLAGTIKDAQARAKKALLRSVVAGFADLPEAERARASRMAARLVGEAAVLSRWTDPQLLPAAAGDDGGRDADEQLLLRKLLHVAVEAGVGTMSDEEWRIGLRVLRRAIRQLGLRKALEVSTQLVTALGYEERNRLNTNGCACVDREFHWIVENTVLPSGYADQVRLHLWIYSAMRRFFWLGLCLPVVELVLSQVVPRCRQPLTLWLLVDGLLSLATAGMVAITYSTLCRVTNQALCQFAGGEASGSGGSSSASSATASASASAQEGAGESEKPRSRLEALTGCSGQLLGRLFVSLGLLVLLFVVGAIGGFIATGLIVVTFMQGRGCAAFTLVICGSFIVLRDSCTIAGACLLYRDLRTLWCAKRHYDQMPPKKRAARQGSPGRRDGARGESPAPQLFPAPPGSVRAMDKEPGKRARATSSTERQHASTSRLLSPKSKEKDCEYGACSPLGKERRPPD